MSFCRAMPGMMFGRTRSPRRLTQITDGTWPVRTPGRPRSARLPFAGSCQAVPDGWTLKPSPTHERCANAVAARRLGSLSQ